MCEAEGVPRRKETNHVEEKHRPSDKSLGKKSFVHAWTYPSDEPGTRPFQGISQASTVGLPPPQNHESVYIEHTGTCRKLGVFALRSWPKGFRIIDEMPVLSCTHWRQRYGTRNVAEEWEQLKFSQKDELRKCFRKLRKVAMGQNDYLKKYDRKRLEDFVEEYAFATPQNDRAHIYKLASHINHACKSCANAEHWIASEGPNKIYVKLIRPVEAGEEIFIYYNRSGDEFACPLCPQITLLSRLKEFIQRLWNLRPLPGNTSTSDISLKTGRRAAGKDASDCESTESIAESLEHQLRLLKLCVFRCASTS